MLMLILQEAMFQFLDGLKPTMTSLGTSIEGLRPKGCNASSKRAWIDTSYCKTVIGLKKTIKIASLNTSTVG